MSMLNQFYEDLADAPNDWKLRGVMADWCEDNNQPELAACLRWMIGNSKRPYHGASGGAAWFNAATISGNLGDPESDLPAALYDRLDSGREVANHKSYTTVRAAEEAFYAAWLAARRDGWSPEGR